MLNTYDWILITLTVSISSRVELESRNVFFQISGSAFFAVRLTFLNNIYFLFFFCRFISEPRSVLIIRRMRQLLDSSSVTNAWRIVMLCYWNSFVSYSYAYIAGSADRNLPHLFSGLYLVLSTLCCNSCNYRVFCCIVYSSYISGFVPDINPVWLMARVKSYVCGVHAIISNAEYTGLNRSLLS